MILLQRIAFCLAIILLPFPAKALDLGSGTLPITHMATPPAKIGPDDAIEIAGTVRGGSANIVLRIDDKWGAAFADRFNGEKTFAPGPFKWVVPASEIKAPNGRVLDLGMIQQFVLFVTSGGTVEVTTFRAAGAGGRSSPDIGAASSAPAASPAPTVALDLGSGTLPITHMATPPAKIGPDDAIEIAGTVRGGSANIVLRIDDKWGAAFADRFNGEKTLAPGPFKWVVPASEIKAPSGRVLDLGMIRQFVLFVTSGGTVEVTTFRAAGAGVDIPTAGASGAAAVKPGAAAPASLPAGRGTMRFEPNDPVDGSGRQLVVEGRIEGSESIGVLLRIDDLQSKDYPSRVGIERTIPAGPFRFQTGIEGLRTPNGRTIDARTIRRIVFGAYPDNRNVVVTRFDLVDAKGLADGAIGYALGAMEATLPTGFQRISPGMRAFQGRQLPQ